ncbi:mechanosensitive ion channel [Candidatus Woesearchaeota archaeon]|nr:mechanosensitive ion channel [Candidatus Woesearchaeota archaeon]
MAFNDLFNISSSNLLINLIAAVIILIAGFILAGVLSKLLKKVLRELETNKILREQANVKLPVEEFLSAGLKFIIYLVAIIMALNQLGLTTTTLQIILGAILTVIIIFIILAFKDFIPNAVAGFLIYQKSMIKKGDLIRVKNIEGRVIHVDLLEIRVMTKNKDVVHIPNSYITKHEVIKMG